MYLAGSISKKTNLVAVQCFAGISDRSRHSLVDLAKHVVQLLRSENTMRVLLSFELNPTLEMPSVIDFPLIPQ